MNADERNRPDVIERRDAWAKQSPNVDAYRFVFLDESGAKTNMTRPYGWGIGGDRVIESIPNGHWCTTTMLAAIRCDSVIEEACLALDGPMTGAVFLHYVQHMLAPSLQPDDVVVMDNLASHKVAGVREAIEAVGAELWYLPPYSPDLNPIERMWSKVKGLIRKAKARGVKQLYNAIGKSLRAVTADELTHYYAASGYATNE